MHASDIPNIQALTVSEKIDLWEELWELIEKESAPMELSDSQRQELDRRYQDAQDHPEELLTLEEFRKRVFEWK